MRESLTVLDGGMGRHLARSGAPFRQPEWSALALLEDPDSVRRAHLDFIEAGADVITVNSYAVVPFHIGQERYRERGAELIELAARLAREAADSVDRRVEVAASMPPVFGSYEPEMFSEADAPAMYDTFVEAQRHYVDLWLGETMSCVGEATAVINAVDRGAGTDARIWMSFNVPDDVTVETVALRSGETIEEAVEAVADRVSAILFNCSAPEAIEVAFAELVTVLARRGEAGRPPDLAIGAFANAFAPRPEQYGANEIDLGARTDMTPEKYRDICQHWVDGGMSIVGGCCHMFPEHIEALNTL